MTGTTAFASQAATLRDNAKWIVAAFTGSGTILFSALSVANLSKVAEGQAWILPVALAAIPLLAAGWAVWRANLVLSAPTPALAELFPEFYALRSGMALLHLLRVSPEQAD
jgi:hypothetical protein